LMTTDEQAGTASTKLRGLARPSLPVSYTIVNRHSPH